MAPILLALVSIPCLALFGCQKVEVPLPDEAQLIEDLPKANRMGKELGHFPYPLYHYGVLFSAPSNTIKSKASKILNTEKLVIKDFDNLVKNVKSSTKNCTEITTDILIPTLKKISPSQYANVTTEKILNGTGWGFNCAFMQTISEFFPDMTIDVRVVENNQPFTKNTGMGKNRKLSITALPNTTPEKFGETFSFKPTGIVGAPKVLAIDDGVKDGKEQKTIVINSPIEPTDTGKVCSKLMDRLRAVNQGLTTIFGEEVECAAAGSLQSILVYELDQSAKSWRLVSSLPSPAIP